MAKRARKQSALHLAYQCPYPDCMHLGKELTNHHCKTAHDMSKKELIAKFGEPKSIPYDLKKMNRNMKLYEPITEDSFFTGAFKVNHRYTGE